LWRWVIGAVVLFATAWAGGTLHDSSRTAWCYSDVDLGRAPTRGQCLAHGGTIHYAGGNGWGILIALLGVLVLSWLVPLMIGRQLFPDRKPRREQEAREKLAAREGWRPDGYGHQAELVWNAQSSEANETLAKIGADGLYDVVSASTAIVGDPIWATNKRIILHLRMRRSAGSQATARAQVINEEQLARAIAQALSERG
jgi:hypothetical protein